MLGNQVAMTWLRNKLQQPWSFDRILRLVLGIFITIQGFMQGSGLLIAFAVILLYQSLSNFRCVPCGDDGGCGPVINTDTNQKMEDTTFEEIK